MTFITLNSALNMNNDTGGSGSGSKRIRFSTESSDQEVEVDSSAAKSIGLRLNKSPSFVNLLETRLHKGKQADTSETRDYNHVSNNDNKKPRTLKGDQTFKAANFPAIFIGIGAWQRITKNEGDLIVKLYYAKRKLVWEILDAGLKSKMEILWTNICAIRATTIPNEPGILEIELIDPPLFYRESNPQPRRHTLWQHATDFTGGQAPIWRRHYVKFPPGVLDKHYQMLLKSDQRLFALSQQPFPVQSSPYFDPTMFGLSQFNFNMNFNRVITPSVCFPRLNYPATLPVMNMDGGMNNQFAPNHNRTIWGEGVTANVQDNRLYYPRVNYGSNMGLLNNVESHLLGHEESQVVCSDEGTLPEKVESMSSLFQPNDMLMNLNNNVNHSGTSYQNADNTTTTDEEITRDLIDINRDLDGNYLENIVPHPESSGNATADQTANNTAPTFVFPGYPTNGNFSHI